MTYLESFLRFLWDFVVGDDWRVAAGVAVAIALTAVAAGAITAWWILPLVVAVLLAGSVWRAAAPPPRDP